MEDLPAELTIDILSRLPVKTIIHCKCVCKKWRNLVLDSSFINIHLSRSPINIIIHHNNHISTDSGGIMSIDPGILTSVEIKDKVDLHQLHHDPLMSLSLSLDLNLIPVFQTHGIDQLGSVNGLICLWPQSFRFNDTYICNPVTREIMILPRPPSYDQSFHVVYGFGVNSLTGEYKVLRTFKLSRPPPLSLPLVDNAVLYTLGTGQWRNLGRVPYNLYVHGKTYVPILNNHFHFLDDATENICTFDLNGETFQLFPSPPSEVTEEERRQSDVSFHSLTVLKGRLCKSEAYDSVFTIWVMKEYGIKESWHKEVRITQDIDRQLFWDPMPVIEKDGSILLVSDGKLWASDPISKTIEHIKIEISGYSVSGVAYRPSFLKLQNFESERVQMF